MFKIIGKVLKGVVKGVKDVLPLPQIGDSIKDFKIKDALRIGKSEGMISNRQVKQIMDILDDGKVNDSVKQDKLELVTRIITGAIPVAIYLLRGIITGEWVIF